MPYTSIVPCLNSKIDTTIQTNKTPEIHVKQPRKNTRQAVEPPKPKKVNMEQLDKGLTHSSMTMHVPNDVPFYARFLNDQVCSIDR